MKKFTRPIKTLIEAAIKVAIIILSLGYCTAMAATCGIDLTGDGLLTSPGESATCVETEQGALCPINAVDCDIPQECPLDPTLACDSGACQRDITQDLPGTCLNTTNDPYPSWQCQETGELFVSPAEPDQAQGQCSQSCVIPTVVTETAACVDQAPECPLGESFACRRNAGVFQCTDLACSTGEAEVSPVDTRMLLDDGERAADGSCNAQINIFNGRSMSCKTAGLDSAFRNCCAEGDGVIQDDIYGVSSSIALGLETAGAIYTASEAAWVVYELKVAAGATEAAASAASTEYFTTVLSASGPTILIGAAVVALAYYYATACSQNDMETATLQESGFCVRLGTKCTNRFPTGCVQRARVYCCFNSKIGRIIHEQGRPQLTHFAALSGGPFGSVESPSCNGFTPLQFQALDFSRIDLSEYYQDIQNAVQTINIVPAMEANINDHVNNNAP